MNGETMPGLAAFEVERHGHHRERFCARRPSHGTEVFRVGRCKFMRGKVCGPIRPLGIEIGRTPQITHRHPAFGAPYRTVDIKRRGDDGAIRRLLDEPERVSAAIRRDEEARDRRRPPLPMEIQREHAAVGERSLDGRMVHDGEMRGCGHSCAKIPVIRIGTHPVQ